MFPSASTATNTSHGFTTTKNIEECIAVELHVFILRFLFYATYTYRQQLYISLPSEIHQNYMHKTDRHMAYPHNGNAHLAANMWLLMMGIDELETTVDVVVLIFPIWLVIFSWVYAFSIWKPRAFVIWCWVWSSQSLRGLSTDQTRQISKYRPSECAEDRFLVWFLKAIANPVDK